ncbi:MAG TPA: hypothetical protein VLJ11_19220 [Bryobacteraceae bacterium]|nr:hypothetical protein [Bryobacteraceae bacterium]
MNNSDNLSRLISGSNKSTGQNISRLLASTNLVGGASATSSGSASPGAQRDLKSLSLLTKSSLTGIQFGSPSSSGTSSAASSSNGSVWGSLLGQTTSGSGLAGLLSSGVASLGKIDPIGAVISGIASLFGGGGKATLPELNRFQLPTSQEQTIYVGSKGTTAYQGNSVQQAATTQPSGGTYGVTGQAQSGPANTDPQWFLDNSNHIAQAVRNAMLNSNSINDVVSEV